MTSYASDTTVSSEKSRNEIERTLTRFGADQFMYGWDREVAVIQFCIFDRHIRFDLPLPAKDDFALTPIAQQQRSPAATEKAWEQGTRSRWRALSLVIKAKLVAVDSGIVEFEEEFLAHIVLPDGQTVGDFMLPQIATAYESGEFPMALPAPRAS